MKNRWKIMSQAGKKKRAGKKIRRTLDDFETPHDATVALAGFLKIPTGATVLEPCAGSGRMVRAIKKIWPSVKVESSDIKRGKNFLDRTKIHKGVLITNPPYRHGMAQAMVDHALSICDGKVAMLLQSGFIWGQQRGDDFFLAGYRPEMIIAIPWRISFYLSGSDKTIDGQFFSHCWVVWGKRSSRASNQTTLFEWAKRKEE